MLRRGVTRTWTKARSSDPSWFEWSIQLTERDHKKTWASLFDIWDVSEELSFTCPKLIHLWSWFSALGCLGYAPAMAPASAAMCSDLGLWNIERTSTDCLQDHFLRSDRNNRNINSMLKLQTHVQTSPGYLPLALQKQSIRVEML